MSIFKLAQEVREGNKVLVRLLVGIGDLLAAQNNGYGYLKARNKWKSTREEALDSIDVGEQLTEGAK